VVVLSPDHILGVLPFSAFCTNNNRHWIEEQSIQLTQTGRTLATSSSIRAEHDFVGLGGIDFGPAAAAGEVQSRPVFKELLHSLEEIRRVDSLLEAHGYTDRTVLTGAAANKDALFELGAPRILHFATHGFYFGNFSADLMQDSEIAGAGRLLVQSGIALAGANTLRDRGLLLAIEVQNLNLEGTELVVVSACETALGPIERNEGIHGLTRAFRIAGARSFLVARGPVGDRDARKFIELFYQSWLSEENVSAADAFETTIRRIITNGLDIDWSSFALYGG
jgi:CHAT domain-containing protein